MSFVLKKAGSTYSWPVEHSAPIDGGKYEKLTFDAEFKRIPQKQVNELISADDATDEKFLAVVLVGFKGIKDESGADVPYSESARRDLLDIPGMAATISTTYLKSIAGEKAKN